MVNIMIADNNIPICMSLSNILHNYNDIRVVSIQNEGMKVIPELKRVVPDILILDLKMPDKNGLDILEEFSNCNELNHKTKIIVMSGEAEYISKVRNYPFVVKFFNKAQLLEEIALQIREITKSIEDRELDKKILETMFEIGFLPTTKGTFLLKDCIVYSITMHNDSIKDLIKGVTRGELSPVSVKSSIHLAVNVMWKNTGKIEYAKEILKLTDFDKPSPGHVIEMIKYHVEYKN